MSASLLAPECLQLAATGRWRDAWDHVRRLPTGSWQNAALADLSWLHDLCLRLGLDVQRRAALRAAVAQHADRLATHAMVVKEHVRRGRLSEAWHAQRATLPPPTDAAESRAWQLARLRFHTAVLDHATTTPILDALRDEAPDDLEVEVEAAWTLHGSDRLDEALALCRRTIDRWPHAPLPRLQECSLLHDANATEAAAHIDALRARMQSPFLDAVFATLCHEAGDLDAARRVFTELLEQRCHERPQRLAWHYALARVCRELGDDEGALAALTAAGRRGERDAERLRAHLAAGAPATARRVVVPVPFVRQDHMTCSPATMSSLLLTFGVAVDQREIAAQITYDGTASHDELDWAERRGLVARFFQFDLDTARQLLDRGLPFALTTRFETSSHRQAVVGYDAVLDSFVLRDPTGNFRREVSSEWLVRIAARGGHCALLLPAATAAAAPPTLPLEAETMQWLQVQLDWRRHRHADADRRIEALRTLPPGPLRFEVESRVALHRGDRRRQLELWREALAAAPEDPYWQYHFAAELLDQNRWDEARRYVEERAPRSPSPFLHRLLADQWRHDARRRDDARAMLRRALRRLGRDARSWHRYAALLWDLDERQDAAELYRLAQAMAPRDESLASSYFWALHDLGRAEAGLDFLRERSERLGARSAAAAGTLADSLETLHRPDEAVEVLRAAVARHDDADRRQHLFDLLLRQHRLAEAAPLLDEPGWRPLARAKARHAFAQRTGDHAAALAALDECVAADPWDDDAQGRRLEHLLEHEGEAAAVAAADALVEQHGESPPLMVAVAHLYDRVEDRARERALLERLVAEHPHEHWLRRRLARLLLNLDDVAAARPLLDELRVTSPDSSTLWLDIAMVAELDGDRAAARAAARRAYELAPDHAAALRRCVDWAPDPAAAADEVRSAMRFVAARPVPPSEAVLQALGGVAGSIPTDEFRAFLLGLERDFPASPAPMVARCAFEQAHDDGAALALATALVARQPWQTQHRLREAACLRAVGRFVDERRALERLVEEVPSCAQGYVELGEVLEREGRVAAALAVFERGIVAVPGSAVLQGMVADSSWRLGDRPRALAAVERACELDRSYAWAFQARTRWLIELGRPDEAIAVVEQLVEASTRWVTAHELHADVLGRVGKHDERIAALRRGLALSPRLGDVRLRLADALIDLKRFDAAREVLAEGRALHGDEPNLALCEARIERTAGRFAAAREHLRETLTRHPDFRSGWVRYLSWCEEEGRHLDILKLYRQPPESLRDEAVLHGYAADAFREQGDPDAAVQALERALELDAGYDWARDTLCHFALDRKQPERVLELLPDHTRPDALPFHRAALVGRAAARRRDGDLLQRVFARMLDEPNADGGVLQEIDAAHRAVDAAANAELLRTLAEREPSTGPAAENRLRLLAGRGDWRTFFRDLSRLRAAVGGDRGLAVASALLADARRQDSSADVADWVAEHVPRPVRDTTAMGHLLYALRTDTQAGARQALRLFDDDWQRPDVEGWMLANLADALLTMQRYDTLVAVCRHAIDHVPHDHSLWWHRRYLAEEALRRGALDEARALCEMPVDDHHDIRLAVHQIDLVAALRQTPWLRRRRLLTRHWREMWRRFDAAAADGSVTLAALRADWLWRACPSVRTLLLRLGSFGARVARHL